ncbi:MAG: hypothetical protein MUC92_01080 [Fimbriimonadaceae bacterium]|nr:hypothetical protein [Fimbriimonadaceae bacterium]
MSPPLGKTQVSLTPFQRQVNEGRAALIELGRKPNELVVVPNQEVRWTHPDGTLLSWVFDEFENIKEFHVGDTTFFTTGLTVG